MLLFLPIFLLGYCLGHQDKSSHVLHPHVDIANDLEPFRYLTYLFEKLPNINFKIHPEVLEDFLPWSKEVQQKCKEDMIKLRGQYEFLQTYVRQLNK